MSVNAEWSCAFHGDFEARVQAGVTPHCPCGCSPEFVERVFLTPPAISHDRVKNASRILKDAIDSMGLSDLDISPHTPGNSPAEKNHLKYASKEIKAEVWDAAKLKGLVSTFPSDSGLALTGLGNRYEAEQWQRNKTTGKLTHSAPRAKATFVKVKE
jgi:hypothetical protein